ncbi:MAG: patatin family protein [Clostridia bacterium]|nr:patatin family protein [Clostridia bacterium]
MKTGIVLEGGALRTIYSSGACDRLIEEGIFFDYVVGVSAGIAYGVSYVSRQFGRNLEILTKYAPDPRYMGPRCIFTKGNQHSYFGLKFIYDDIPNRLVPYDYDAYDRYKGEVEAVVTDMATGKPVYLPVDVHEKDMMLLQATCALPVMFPPYTINGMRVMDGGCADSVPWKHAFDMGCDRVVVILTRERSYRRKKEKIQGLMERMYRKYPDFVETLRQRPDRYNRDREELFEAEKAGKVYIIAPDSTEGFSRTEKDVDKIKALWQQGYDHAKQQADALREFLKG